MNTTKYIVPLLLIAAILIGAGVVYSRIGRTPSSSSTPPSATTLPPSPSVAVEYKEYHNSAHGYRLLYPASLQVFSDSKTGDIGIGSPEDGNYWQIDVHVEATALPSPQEWLEQNKERYALEGKRTVGGSEAIVVYMVGDGETYKEDKSVILIKNGYFFRISTRYVEHEKIWDSFRFE